MSFSLGERISSTTIMTLFQVLVILISLEVIAVKAGRLDRSINTPFVITTFGLGEPASIYRTQNMSRRPTIDEYKRKRDDFFHDEKIRALGSNLELNEREKLANLIIMKAKNEELSAGFESPYNFTPSRHIFEVLDDIKKSKLFQLIQAMPKGGVLHAHDTALCNLDYVMSLTYIPDLWQCRNPTTDSYQFKFSKLAPDSIDGCTWSLVSMERERQGRREYDKEIRKVFTLFTNNPESVYKDDYAIWTRFIDIFITLGPIVTYYPVWKEYFKTALHQFYNDGVQYLEFRGILPTLYDLNGTTYTQQDTVQIYVDILNEFKEENPGFIGSKFIYAPNRKVDDITFEQYMKTIVDLQHHFPNFIAGFDIVSHEDTGRPLIDFAGFLLGLPESINFFFHAGETNWNGQSTDENLVDAVLLGTKRIGHAYAILKHPKVLEAVKEHRIALEVNPISNQVLKLNNDNRNHPSTFLFSDNYPVVISSDDPSFWETSPLSHDFYIAFLGIASAHSDLRTLKQLAINSIEYSSLDDGEKKIAFRKWQDKWDEYIENLIYNSQTGTTVKFSRDNNEVH